MHLTRASALTLIVFASACGGVRGGSVPAPVRSLRHEVDSLLADPRLRNAHLGVLVVDPVSGDTLLSHNAGKLFMPASNQKILTGAVALTLLGPDFRFSTSVFADGVITQGTLTGNLRFEGMG
ncbi:MAG: D-alanyl-D-alanine carboxypeptidase, partial [Cytophagaceae bacterium]|nr:D-alanyl-D-alanine carboxypeptidase [Gemmatimonadaceae bacterium]